MSAVYVVIYLTYMCKSYFVSYLGSICCSDRNSKLVGCVVMVINFIIKVVTILFLFVQCNRLSHLYDLDCYIDPIYCI